jgi:putative ATP-dependent DNA ligase
LSKHLSSWDLNEAIRARKARHDSCCSVHYLRFTDRFKNIPRGTAVFNRRVIWGFPSIGRILHLETGLKEQFTLPFWVEEKIDGYNVRIFRLKDRLLALTRGGFLCPFTIDRLPDLLDTRIFMEYPDIVLCSEVAGPENPYLNGHPPFIEEDVQCFVFDMMRQGRPGFLPHAERLQLQEKYHLPTAPVFGKFDVDQLPTLKELLRRMNEEGREGVVFKEESPKQRRAKYVTSHSSIYDILTSAHEIKQLPPEYFINRVVRLVLFMDETGLPCQSTTERGLGHAFLHGLFQAIEQFKNERRVYETFRCRFRNKTNAHHLIDRLKHTGAHIHVVQRRLEWQDGFYVLEFEKDVPALTGLLGHLLSGGLVFD